MAKLRSQKYYSPISRKSSYKPKNLRPFPIKVALAFLFFALVFGGIFYFLFFSEYFSIKSVAVEGQRTIQGKDIRGAVAFVLSSKKMGVLPLNNFLLLPDEKLRASLIEGFPKIATLEIKKMSPNRLGVIISEREASGIWCLVSRDLVMASPDPLRSGTKRDGTQETCFYFDKEGVAFEESSKSVGSLILSVEDEREKTRYMGEVVLEEERIEFFLKIKELVDKNFPFIIKNFVIKRDGEIELLTSGIWRILFDKTAAPEFQLSNLKYILDEEIGPRINELEYVDLRLGNRVYYKFK